MVFVVLAVAFLAVVLGAAAWIDHDRSRHHPDATAVERALAQERAESRLWEYGSAGTPRPRRR